MTSRALHLARLILTGLLLTGLILTAVAGCGAGPDEPPPRGLPAPGSSAAGDSSPTDDPADCVNARCQLRVTGPVTIPLEPSLGVTNLAVTSVGEGSVTLAARFAPGTGAQAISTGGSCSTNLESGSDSESSRLKADCEAGTRLRIPGVTIDIDSAEGGVMLRLTPR